MEQPTIGSLPIEPAQTTTDQVFKALYDAVISLHLPPGSRLSEADVAKQFDVSRQPVRDAFFRLSKLGFLQVRPQRATLVTRISAKAVLDAVFVRAALEVECCTTVATAGTDLSDLHHCLARQERAADTTDPEEFHALDEAFHRILCRLAGHENVWDIILEQKAHMDRVRWLTLSAKRRRQVLGEHARIVEALSAADPAAAAALMRSHIGDVARILPDIRAAHPDHFDPRA